MKKLIYLLAVVVFFMRCTPKDKKIPKEILPVDSMKIIVWQLIQAGDYATFLKGKDTGIKLKGKDTSIQLKEKDIKPLNTAYFSQVLQLHHLDKASFFKSFNFYQTHPYFNDILFDSVNAYAQRQRNQIYKYRAE